MPTKYKYLLSTEIVAQCIVHQPFPAEHRLSSSSSSSNMAPKRLLAEPDSNKGVDVHNFTGSSFDDDRSLQRMGGGDCHSYGAAAGI